MKDSSLDLLINNASKKIRVVIDEISINGYSMISPFVIGLLDDSVINFVSMNNIAYASSFIYMTPQQISHTLRDSKRNSKFSVSEVDLIDFPQRLPDMDIYYDTVKGNIIYTDYVNKYIVVLNYKMKLNGMKTEKVNYITACKVASTSEFGMKEKIKIK